MTSGGPLEQHLHAKQRVTVVVRFIELGLFRRSHGESREGQGLLCSNCAQQTLAKPLGTARISRQPNL